MPEQPAKLRALTDRDLDILSVLTRRVRVLSVAQIARTWWPDSTDPTTSARRRMKALETSGLLRVFQAVSHPEIPMLSPTVSWEPGQPIPNLAAASYRLKIRWTRPPLLMNFTIPTIQAARLLGLHGGRRPREVELTHDLHLAAVYLFYRATWPETAAHWVHEEELKAPHSRPQKGVKLPDAMILGTNSPRIVEFGGAYGKHKLYDFHQFCESNSLPYEVW